MTPIEILEILGAIALSSIIGATIPIIIMQFYLMIKRFKAMRNIRKVTNEIFKNIDKDMKELKRAEFFEDLERIKKENKEEK